jgi:hypothetical protein
MPVMNRRAALWLSFWGLLLLGGCQSEPESLAPGRCRTDVDCPGSERCIPEAGDAIGRCGCLEDLHCPGSMRCDREARRCGCTADAQCPAGLACEDGRCVCDGDAVCNGVACSGDEECPPPSTCDPELGVCRAGDAEQLPACTCDASGICVRPRRSDGPFDPPAAPTCNVDARSVHNACGGRGPLVAEDCGGADALCESVPVEPGAACGAGGWGRWTCSGCDAPPRCCVPEVSVRLGLGTCCDPRGGTLECGALAASEQVLGLDDRAVCCPDDHVLDPCGACVGPGDPLFRSLVAAIDAGAVVNDPCRDEAPGAAAPVGVWRCEAGVTGQRAICVSCPAGTPPNACGGCELIERIGGVAGAEGEAITARDIGAPCGGPAGERGFATACAGRLTCLDARTIYCEAEAPGNRCPGHCGAVEVARADDAGGGTCLLDGDSPEQACRTVGELAAAAARTDAGGGAGSLDDLRDGAPCGPCGDGRWTCGAGGAEDGGALRLDCIGADLEARLNICGQCGPEPTLERGVEVTVGGVPCDPAAPDAPDGCVVAPSSACRIVGDPPIPGALECDAGGRSLLVCVGRPANACGGLGELDPPTAEPRVRCGACADWEWRCQGEDRIVCVDPTVSEVEPARTNACGGCSPLVSDFPGPTCPPTAAGAVRAPVCLEDRSGEVCIYFDGEFANVSDADGRCNCVRHERDAIEPVVTIFGECFYLVDGDLDGEVDERRRCDDNDPAVTDCGGLGETCCPRGGVPRCANPRHGCAYDPDAGAEICVPCGDEDEVCCGGETCPGERPGQPLACSAFTDTCQRCGGNRQICCGDDCNPGFGCTPDGFCAPCGGDGEPCCGTACEDGLACDARLCAPCGERGQPCCEGQLCDDELACQGGRCADCGEQGQACCVGGEPCEAPLACSAGLCAECGEVNQACCVGGQPCELGAVCNGVMCIGRLPPSPPPGIPPLPDSPRPDP